MNSALFILALLSIVSSIVSEQVIFNGQFECKIAERANNYCMLVRYMEEDNYDSHDDEISIGKVQCGGPKNSYIKTWFAGGDGLFNYHYEFKSLISHTCTYDGRIKLYKYYFPEVHVDTKQYKFDYKVDLTEQGVRVSDYFDTKQIQANDERDTKRNNKDRGWDWYYGESKR